MVTAATKNWVFYSIPIFGKWSYLINKPNASYLDGIVSELLYDSKEEAIAAAFEYLKINSK